MIFKINGYDLNSKTDSKMIMIVEIIELYYLFSYLYSWIITNYFPINLRYFINGFLIIIGIKSIKRWDTLRRCFILMRFLLVDIF
jgi:hypothetical protein